jgi:aryl-alcohol dehydrogenase-like predicted oxidoreductase
MKKASRRARNFQVQSATRTNRRNFLKAVSSAGALAVLGSVGALPGHANGEPAAAMQYRRLGKTGLMVSEIGFGGHHYTMRKRLEEKEAGFDYQAQRTRQVAAALDHGVNYFDTTYDHEAECLGNALAELKGRDKCYIACDYWMNGTKSSDVRLFASRRFEYSLKVLKTDHVDVYRPTTRDKMKQSDLETLFELFTKWKQEGKVRFFGISGHDETYLMWAIETFPLDLIMVPYSVGLQKAAEKLFPFAKQHDVGVVVIKPFAGGSLFRAAEVVKELKKLEGESVARAALRFILENPNVSTIVPGANTVEEVQDNVQASGKKLGDATRRALRTLAAALPEHLDPHYRWLTNWRMVT